MIYTINTATNVMFPVIKSVFKLSDEEVYRMINNEHSKLLDKLQKKGINYSQLKRALIPNQKKENNEVCLVFDTMQIKEDFYGNEETYFEMFTEWINTLNKELNDKSYHDLLGYLYEDNVQSKGKAKDFQQYYTPQNVTEVMSELVMHKKAEEYKGGWANDPCCGSGRFLLASHFKSKGGLYCLGQDLDETSCKMTVLNFYSHGVRGSVLHMNTLSGEFYKGWRVNKWLLHGIPVPHIEEINTINEAYNFIGVNQNIHENKLDKTTTDGQTTLI